MENELKEQTEKEFWLCRYERTNGDYARCIANMRGFPVPIRFRKCSLDCHALIPGDEFNFYYSRIMGMGEVKAIEPIIGKPLSQEEIEKYRAVINDLPLAIENE